MRQIKFRGRKLPIDGGDWVFGDYRKSPAGEGIFEQDNYNYWRIQPGSVAQLVDCDIDGTEYYEGDERIIDGVPHVCSLTAQWEAKS